MRGRPASRRTPSRALLASLVCLAPLVAGCGGDDSSRAVESTSSPTSGATPSAPAADPAGGRKVSLAAFSAHTVEGYDYDNSLAREIVFSSSRDLGQDITFSDVTVYPGTSTATAMRLTIKNSSWQPTPRIASPVTIDGERWYHLTGPIGDGKHLEDFGIVYDSRLVRISFELTAAPAKREQIVDSVLATVDLK